MKELYDLDPNEVSLVDEGANRKKFLVMKNREGKMQRQEIEQLIKSVDPKVMANVERVLKSAKEGDASLSERAQAALKAVARILAPFKEEINDGHLDAIQNEIGMKNAPGDKMDKDDIAKAAKEKEEKELAEKAAKEKEEADKAKKKKPPFVDDDQDEEDEEEEDVEKANDPNKEESVGKEKVNKSALDLTAFPEGQRAQLEAVFKSNADLQLQNKELVQKQANLEKSLADRDAKEKQREYVAKAAEFKGCGLPVEEIVETLKDAATVGEKSYERVCKQFATMSTQVEKGAMFKEIGSRQGADANSAEARLDKLVEMHVAKADGKESKEQVYARVLASEEGQKLYGEFKANRPGGI